MTHTTEVTDDAESSAQRDGHGRTTLANVHAAPDERFDREERQTVFVSDTVTFGPGTHELPVELPSSRTMDDAPADGPPTSC